MSILLSAVWLPLRAEENDTLIIEEWLQLDPVDYHYPVYHDIAGVDGQPWTVKELLDADQADYREWTPEEGLEVSWSPEEQLTWSRRETIDGRLVFPGATDEAHQISWSAVYLTTDRWVSATLTLESPWLLRAFLNGEEIGSKHTTETGEDAEPGTLRHSVNLKQGTHMLLVKTIHPAGDSQSLSDQGGSDESGNTENSNNSGQSGDSGSGGAGESGELAAEWTLKSMVEADNHINSLASVLHPDRNMKLSDLSDAPRPESAIISPDGELAAIRVQRRMPPDGENETRIDIRKVSDGSLYRRYAGGMKISGMQWVPVGRSFSYTTNGDDGTDLWLADLETGEKKRILRDVEEFSGYRWAPDGTYIIYSVTERHKPGTDGVQRHHGLQDRRPGYHNRSFLYQLNVEEGTTRRLTAGKLTTSLSSIHPDGSEILFLRSHEVYDERPYDRIEYVILDLESMETDSLFSANFGGYGAFSPDGDRILITGGPNTFGEIGVNVPDSLIANDYDTQAYIYHRESGEIEAISREFDPAISTGSWDETGRYIHFVVTDKAYGTIYRYDTRQQRYREYETGPDVVNRLDLAENTAVGVFTGSGASDTPKVWTLDFNRENPEARMLYDPAAEAYRHVQFGEVRPWTFTNNFGEEIDGHVYYPPDFNENEEYPVIVYYYGGTSPTSRAFGGRYPKELYAAKGYIVYVLQPSGATGFGQEFSARHVNDWGEIAGSEIISGVEAFLEAHSYADRERVGAIGASYGGFMTMNLLTRTDLFAAAISHAGISNLTSYWGEGFWGYQYSGVATANSFPWNRRDIYVDQSPVFNADDIHTPLLLITGLSDTNVPPGESLQMFTALKLLDRDVAFIGIEGENHHILDYNKYILWKEAIISWFDHWLKGEPEWWEETHGE